MSDKVEVIRKEDAEWVVGVQKRIYNGRTVYDIATASQWGIKHFDWSDNENVIGLFGEDLDALCRWWLKKNPALLGQMLTDEQREALEWANETAEEAVVDCDQHGRIEDGKNCREVLAALQSILNPKEG